VIASTRNEVFELCSIAIHLAVLSDSLGKSSLRGVAENLRRQWPRARILILGAPQTVLDDPLYDEAVDRRISPEDLLAALVKLSTSRSNCRGEVARCNADDGLFEFVPRSGRQTVHKEGQQLVLLVCKAKGLANRDAPERRIQRVSRSGCDSSSAACSLDQPCNPLYPHRTCRRIHTYIMVSLQPNPAAFRG
jgi:hypothetical protein